MPSIEQITNETQFGGGLHGGETAIAHLALKSGEDLIEAQGLCPITLFTDIAGAFGALWRQIVLLTHSISQKFGGCGRRRG